MKIGLLEDLDSGGFTITFCLYVCLCPIFLDRNFFFSYTEKTDINLKKKQENLRNNDFIV